MITIRRVEDLETLWNLRELFHEGYREMNKRRQAFETDLDGFMRTLIGILNMTPQHGGVFVAYLRDETPVGFGAAYESTPQFATQRHLLLWALYVVPTWSRVASTMLFDAAKLAAVEQGFDVLHAFNPRFTGSSFNFFEKVLGMRRARVQFSLELKKL